MVHVTHPAAGGGRAGGDQAEDVRRSLILPPTVFGPQPTTDAAAFYTAGVPIVNFLTAPFYLFDSWTRSTRSTGRAWCR